MTGISRSWRLVFFLVALFGWSVAAAVTIHLSDGDVDGEATPNFQAYRGIPFAEPPLGKLRFSPPIPAKPWKPKVLDAKKYRHNCMQGSKFTPGQPRDTVDEDCLYLNVFVPTKKVESPMALPVFVWIHGGGYQGGGANESRLNGTFDVALDSSAIIVVPNYRLNIFGFLAGKMLRSKDPAGGTGNMGILDQRLALKWVQSNIKAFGGDPSRVFLVGESAGGASVTNHLVRKNSWGLFSRAGIESGGYTLIDPQDTADDFEKTFQDVLKKTKCDKGDDASSIACLESVDPDTLLGVGARCDPVVDGVDLTDQILTLYRDGATAPGVPVLAGSVREDLGFLPGMKCEASECNETDFRTWAKDLQTNMFPGIKAFDVDKMVAAYSDEAKLAGGNNSAWWWAAKHAGSDACMICPARWSVRWVDTGFLFSFEHAPEHTNGYPSLAFHSSEVPFVFHVLSATGPNADKMHIYSETEVVLSAAMVRYWLNFASSGDPSMNHDIPPPQMKVWPQYQNSSDDYMVFGGRPGGKNESEPQVVGARFAGRCDFWDAVLLGPGDNAKASRRRMHQAAMAALRR